MAVAEARAAKGEVDGYLQHFAGLRAQRVDFDVKNQLVSDYILPRRDFTATLRPNQLRPSRVTSSVATNANTRMAALMLAYLIDYTRPFLLPNVKRGLVSAGRQTDLDEASQDYLGALEWQVFDHLMLPKAQLMMRLGSMLKEYCAFGNGVLWVGRRRGFGPYVNARPVMACWWSENEEGVIDTLYFRIRLPIWRVLQRYPDTAPALWPSSDVAKPDENALTDIVLACCPRAGGVYGAVRENKPFAYVAISEEKGAVLERSGFDSFPYAVFRHDPMPGNAYAEGVGGQVLPDVMVLNHIQQALENGASQDAMPPLAMPARMFAKALDRRPGAMNLYAPQGLGIQRADQAILKLSFTGNLSAALQLKPSLIQDIEIGYFTDWLRLREAGDMTAEEVNERRDMRLRGMASIVANCELPMSVLGDRGLDVMVAENQVAPAPAQLAGVDVDWEYAGPLQIAQLRGNAQVALQLINARALAAKDPVDPIAAQAIDLEEALRTLADALGAGARMVTSRAKVAASRRDAAEKQAREANAQRLAQVAGAAKDGADAAAGVMGAAAPSVAPGGAPAPFAPAAPFATPIAA